jgi:hypothetical protein
VTPNIRYRVYLFVAVLFSVLVARGVISSAEAPLWLEMAALLLGVGSSTLAAANVDRSDG